MLVLSSGHERWTKKKSSESPRGTEPQTLRFRALMLCHYLAKCVLVGELNYFDYEVHVCHASSILLGSAMSKASCV